MRSVGLGSKKRPRHTATVHLAAEWWQLFNNQCSVDLNWSVECNRTCTMWHRTVYCMLLAYRGSYKTSFPGLLRTSDGKSGFSTTTTWTWIICRVRVVVSLWFWQDIARRFLYQFGCKRDNCVPGIRRLYGFLALWRFWQFCQFRVKTLVWQFASFRVKTLVIS